MSGRGLGEAVALEDEDADRAEEAVHRWGQGAAARYARDEAAAQLGLDRLEHEDGPERA